MTDFGIIMTLWNFKANILVRSLTRFNDLYSLRLKYFLEPCEIENMTKHTCVFGFQWTMRGLTHIWFRDLYTHFFQADDVMFCMQHNFPARVIRTMDLHAMHEHCSYGLLKENIYVTGNSKNSYNRPFENNYNGYYFILLH